MTWTMARADPPVESAIVPGESVRWSGAPPRGLLLRRSDAFAIPLSLMWGGFAFFWEGTVVTHEAPAFFSALGVPFVAVGLYLVLGRFFCDAYVRAHTRYAVTDRAVYFVRSGLGGGTRRLSGSALGDVRVARSADGSGTLTFGDPSLRRDPWMSMYSLPATAFERIRDVDAAYAAIVAARS